MIPYRTHLMVLSLMLSVLGTLACHDLAGLAGSQQLPSGTPNPSVYASAAGALALYEGTLTAFQNNAQEDSSNTHATGTFVDYVLYSGLLTDELQPNDIGCTSVTCTITPQDIVDSRQLIDNQPYATDAVYTELQAIRNAANDGIGALSTYDDSAPSALTGHLYALQGYAEILLADLFCSGIPLSTMDFGKDFTYRAGSPRDSVYRDALAKFKMAMILASDSVRILNFSRVGQGRALLALGQYDSAALAVATVPDTFAYSFPVDWSCQGNNKSVCFIGVSDAAGGTGLPYISSSDVRTAAQVASTGNQGEPVYWPVKYGGSAPSVFSIHVADGIEARLIQSEAALQAKQYGSWLTLLNRARLLAAPSETALTDPGESPNDSVRVALLFQERAYDLFMTGHRQGDLRRLLRQYSTIYRSQLQVYPSGPYPLSQVGFYGQYVTAPIPTTELANPKFQGCLSRGA